MKNILTIDVGNTNFKIIAYDEDMKIIFNKRVKSIRHGALIQAFFEDLKKSLDFQVDLVAISCVIPAIIPALEEGAQAVFACPVIFATAERTDLDILLDDKEAIGQDFVATAHYCVRAFNEACIVIDMGSANKIIVIEEPNMYLGGIISPGLQQQIDTYRELLSHLPKVELSLPSAYIGHNTVDAIKSGIANVSYLGLLALADKMEIELGKTCRKIITGGYSNLFEIDEDKYTRIPDIVNDGLYHMGIENFNK